MAAAPWSNYAKIVGQDVAATDFSQYTGKGQVVAIIDTGVDYTHPNLGGGFGVGHKVIAGYDFVDNDADPMDHVEDGHGTFVAGMIAGSQFVKNGHLYQGVAPDAKLVALRTGTAAEGFSPANLQKAFDWITNNYKKYGITAVNMSLGGGAYTEVQSMKLFRTQTKKLKDLGIAVIAASGNDGWEFGDTVSWPAAEASIYAIGSTNDKGQASGYSDRGQLLDLFAPGEEVTSTQVGGGFGIESGTSFASPFIAGVYAVVQQAAGGGLRPDDVMSILRTSSTTLYDSEKVNSIGYDGIITSRAYAELNLPAAINLAIKRGEATAGGTFAAGKSTDFDVAYDSQDVLHLAYRDTSTKHLMYTTRLAGGDWTAPVLVDGGNDVGAYVSIAIDPTGKPAIAYYDAANQDLKFAAYSGSAWSTTTLDDKGSVGQYASLGFTSNGDAAIAYYRKTGGDLRLMTYDHTKKAWSRRVVDSAGNVGQYASLATFRENTSPDLSIVSSYETIGIAYADSTNGKVNYWSSARSNVSTVMSKAYESTTTVDDLSGSAANISLLYENHDGAGQATVAYQDAANADVKYAYRFKGKWIDQVVAANGNVGSNISTYVGTDGYHVVYFDKTKKASYDARIGSDYRVADIGRVGTIGSLAAAAFSPAQSGGTNVTLIGLTKSGKSFAGVDLA